jgi:peptidoglycan hydrolase-like protein with peptidoglycan-binding domain/predicted nucleotidyltransferase
MAGFKKVLKSFHIKNNLNSKVWVEKNGKFVMDNKVREHLLSIAENFIDFLKVDIVVSDIVLTGSLANYNWSDYSDFDLHVIADFDQFDEDKLDLYKELFAVKKTLYNDEHDITIYGYEVELYVQDENESHFSSGVYSVLYDKWLVKPKKEGFELDEKVLKQKVQSIMNQIDTTIEDAKEEPTEKAVERVNKLRKKIKEIRGEGLKKGGEFSYENLAFKFLRRNGYIQKLFDFESDILDKEFSIEQREMGEDVTFGDAYSKLIASKIAGTLMNKLPGMNESTLNIGGPFNTDLENSPENHKSRAMGDWQSDNSWDVFAPPGSVVNSYTDGVVTKVYDTGKNSGQVFGTQIEIKGTKPFPDIFYTHITNVKLQKGDTVNVGDYIGEVMRWESNPKSSHVHIGLPYGYELKDLLVNSEIIFNGDDNSKESKKPIDIKSNFLKKLVDLLKLDKTYKNLKEPGKKIPYDSGVELLQTALQILGFSLPKWGVDGLFGPETKSAVTSFQKDNGLDETGVMEKTDIKKLIESLIKINFNDADLSKVQKTSDFNKINVGSDKEFYESILNGIGAPITDENMKFLYAWRKGESGKATNNPFNTTYVLDKDKNMTKYNSVGVKNYSTPNYGIEATVKTLLLPPYTCIVNGLRNDIGADKISKCESLKTWGTGNMVAQVLDTGKIEPPKIYA